MTPPDVSVIITTYRRLQQLARVLKMLAQQDYPKDRFEVIVVNDGGLSLWIQSLRPSSATCRSASFSRRTPGLEPAGMPDSSMHAAR